MLAPHRFKLTLRCTSFFSPAEILKRSVCLTVPCLKAARSKPNLSSEAVPAICSPTSFVSSPKMETVNASVTSLPQQYLMLSKIRLTSLVVMTSMGGYAMAPGVFDPLTIVVCSFGTGLLSCAANALNQFHEVPFDAQMARTRNRLLVKGVITPLHAAVFASVCTTTGGLLLYFGASPLTAALGFANVVLYSGIYTPLKRVSILNTWVGSVVGALPPLMGWSACTGSLEGGAWILAGILYAWQFPHFNALSWNLRPDYSRAGYRMMAVTNPGLCRRTTLRYTGVILGLSCLAPSVGLTNDWFVLESLPLNSYFLYLAWKFYKESDSSNSRKLFRFSLIHLPALMLLMLINKKSTNRKTEDPPGIENPPSL